MSETCRFGKHKGKPWSDVPSEYLKWVLEQENMREDTKDICRVELGRRAPSGVMDAKETMLLGASVDKLVVAIEGLRADLREIKESLATR